jgi:FtsW/RodA/SpoVE-like cell cycle protein
MPRRLENDLWLFCVTLGLCLLGAVMIFSASAVTAENDFHHSYYFLLRQSAWLFIGLAGMFVLMRTDYRRLREPAVVYSVLCIVGLMLLGAFFLDKSHATHRWIRFGPVGFQPSEFAKLAVILYLAWFLDLKRRHAAAMEFRKDDFVNNILPAIGPILVCVALILAQPDLGTSVDIVLIAAAVLYVAGMSWKWIAAGAVDHSRRLSPGAFDGFPQPGFRSAGSRLSIIAIAHRRRLRWIHWRWFDGEQTKVILFAGSSHRFYLRRHLRGARFYRRDDRHCPFCRLWMARTARGICCTR